MAHVNKREIIIAVFSLFIGLMSMNFYLADNYKKDLKANKEITLGIIDNSITAFEVSDALVNNCSDAYSEVVACFSNYKRCDLNSSQAKLEQLNDEKTMIQARLKTLIEAMDLIIAKKKTI